jgi:LmbE family N-acetylglucosaminyl deacetylase
MATSVKIILGVFFLGFVCLQIALYWVNEIRLPRLDIKKLTGKKGKIKILAIDPHPDDETMLSGGFIAKYSRDKEVEIKHISITKGEKGDEIFKVTEAELAEIRANEYKMALHALGCEKFEMWDFHDGKVEDEKDLIFKKLNQELKTFQPDIILTYERAGLYGHPDHVALTQIVHQLVKEKYPNIKVLYKTLTKRVLKTIKLPFHMANGKEIVQSAPTIRLPILKYIPMKYRACRYYKSQNLGQGKPLWLIMILLTNEYYTDKY